MLATVMISIRILEQTDYSDIRDLNPAMYMLINFSLKSQKNPPLTFSEKHFIMPHSANLFNVIVRDRERESKMRRKKVQSQCGSEYQQ